GARAFSLATLVAATVLVLLLATLFGASPARAYSAQPIGAPIEPNPGIEGNVTVSTHNTGWAPLQYTNSLGTSSNNSASLDPRVVNPITVTPTDVVAPGQLQGEKVAGSYWNTTSFIVKSGAAPNGGAVLSNPAVTTINGQPAVSCAMNESSHGGGTTQVVCSGSVAASLFPSQNVQFDYATMGLTFSGAACGTCYAYLGLSAGSSAWVFDRYASNGTIKVVAAASVAGTLAGTAAVGSQVYASVPLSLLGAQFLPSAGNAINFQVGISLPQGSAGTFTTYLTQLSFTTGPMAFGVTTWAAKPITLEIGSTLNLSTFVPSFTFTSVTAGGYQAAVIQYAASLANATATASAVSLGNATSGGAAYVEQITYSFQYGLPVAPSLTYSSFKLIDRVNISGIQYSSVTFGGTSYTAAYNGYGVSGSTTCTGLGVYNQVQAAVTATTVQSWIGIVLFTGPQWDSISQAPGIFSANGLQYWWYVFIGAIIALGGAIGGTSAWVVKNKRALSVRRGVGRVPFLRLAELLEHRRNLRADRRGMAGRHLAMIVLGAVFGGAGAIALWAIFNGADTLGAAGSFIAGLLLLLLVVAIAFVVFEVGHHIKHRRYRA
ncbi:MAG: hypothetical protein L3J91_00130, partial [Thermoplasmata archaeon]|nr:hypothetical protein [Thermoplasmata archaeon]